MKFLTILALFSLSLISPSCLAEEGSGPALFEKLKSLEGDWRFAEPKRATKINFRQIANGSTLVETWTMSPTRTSMTVYTLDGKRLLMTHYCPQGNAPRLVYTQQDADGLHQFKFLDGANINSKDASHQHASWIRFESDGSFTRTETYIKNGTKFDPAAPQDAPQTFVRVK